MASVNGESNLELGENLETGLESAFESSFEQAHEEEQFLGGLLNAAGSMLGLGESSYEDELTHELSHEFTYESEQGEEFFGKLKKLARGFVKVAAPALGKIAKIAAPMVATAVGGPLGGMLAKAATSALGEEESEIFETDREGETEVDREIDREEEMSHESIAAHEALGEYMAAVASEAATEAEADAMAAAAAVTGLSAADRAALRRVLPSMVRGVAILTRILRKNRATRPAVRVVPTVVRRSVKVIRRKASAGQPVTRQVAARVMADQTRKVLRSPHRCAIAIEKNARATRAVARDKRSQAFAF